MLMDIIFNAGSNSVWWKNLLIQLIPSVCVALIVAWLTVKLTFRRHIQEKWWERKANEFDQLVKAFKNLEDAYDIKDESRWQGEKIPHELLTKSNNLNMTGKNILQEMKGIAGYLLPIEVKQMILEYERKISKLEYVVFNMEAAALAAKYKKKIIRLAKREIGVH